MYREFDFHGVAGLLRRGAMAAAERFCSMDKELNITNPAVRTSMIDIKLR